MSLTRRFPVRRSPADVRKLVDGLIAATRAMEHRAKSLEGELQASSQQDSELRDKLADVRKESLTDQLTCIANRKAFDEAFAGSAGPADVTNFMVIYSLVDIKMRMLRVLELLKIQGFPDNYQMVGNQSDQKKFIGNSVHPLVPKHWAEALAGRLLKISKAA